MSWMEGERDDLFFMLRSWLGSSPKGDLPGFNFSVFCWAKNQGMIFLNFLHHTNLYKISNETPPRSP